MRVCLEIDGRFMMTMIMMIFELGFIIVRMTYGNADNDQGYGHPKD